MNPQPEMAPAPVEPAVVADVPEAHVEVAAVSEKGPRDENQDWLSWVQSPRGEIFIVADGMGGYKGGAQAARLTVQGIETHLAAAPAEWPFARALEHAVALTNRDVHQLAHSGDPELDRMGSTVVVAMVADGKLQLGHVGDSRAYLFRDGQLRLLTHDHTQVQQMVDAKMLTPRQARNHPDGHVLTRAIGSRPEVEVDIRPPIRLQEGDALLMCSDGLSGFVDDRAIRGVLTKQPDVQQVPGELVATALAAGGSDNITIQFVKFGASFRQRWTTKLPTPDEQAKAPEAARRSGWPWRPIALAAALVLATAVGVWWLVGRPKLELTYISGAGVPNDQVTLRWSAPNADEVRIEPNVGQDVMPREGTVRVAAPVSGPMTYTATATTKVMWWTLRSEDTVTIPARATKETRTPAAADASAPTPPATEAPREGPAAKPAAPQNPAADPTPQAPRGNAPLGSARRGNPKVPADAEEKGAGAQGRGGESQSRSEPAESAPTDSVPTDPAAPVDDGK